MAEYGNELDEANTRKHHARIHTRHLFYSFLYENQDTPYRSNETFSDHDGVLFLRDVRTDTPSSHVIFHVRIFES
jgi:hypothetical protein